LAVAKAEVSPPPVGETAAVAILLVTDASEGDILPLS